MSRNVCTRACGVALALLAVIPAQGQKFTYSEDFNDWQNMPNNGAGDTLGAIPIGWIVTNSNNPAYKQINPQVFAYDGLTYDAGWQQCWGSAGGCYDPAWGSGLGTAGQVDYTVPWSGTPGDLTHSGRFTIMHQNWENFGRTSAAWYTGVAQANYSAKHTGTYPLQLKTSSLKVTFDLAIRTGTNAGCVADGGTFAIQPVQDVDHIVPFGNAGGDLGWGLNGLAVEFDIYPNGFDPAAPDQNNHLGLDVALTWDHEAGTLPSIATSAGLGLPSMVGAGNNNQPLHVTVYYNDPAHGGIGVVQVYVKIDPATKLATDPAVPADQTPFSYGMDTANGDDPVDGKLVVQACVGEWPTDKAVFGFTAASGGCNQVFQVDNLNVQTESATGQACTPAWVPAYDAGGAVALNASPVATDVSSLSQPGWDVTSYPALYDNYIEPVGPPNAIDLLKQNIAYAEANGLRGPMITGQPDVNYFDWDGGDGIMPVGRRFAGLGWPDSAQNQYFAILAKGYIYFPQAGDYSLDVSSDNGFELMIGGQVVATDRGGNWGNGKDAVNSGIFVKVSVAAAGVYPIQLIFEEEWGGASVEFYRRTGSALAPFVLVGATNGAQGTGGFADQPMIYGLLSGQAAAIDLSGVTPGAPVVTLSTTLRVGDASVVSGEQKFNMKTVWLKYPHIGIETAWIEDWRQEALNWLEFLPDLTPGATTELVNMEGAWWDYAGALPYWHDFAYPQVAADADNIGMRAEGFAVFPGAGHYVIGLEGDDEVYLRFGSQTILQQPCCWDQQTALYVPQAGTYPIRVDFIGAGRENRVKLYEVAPGVGKVAVNSGQSRIKVYQTAATGAFAYKNEIEKLAVIPADRKIADVGQGGTLGWDATAVKAPAGVSMDNNMGLASALIENDLVGVGVGLLTQATATPLYINFKDVGDGEQGEFQAVAPDASYPSNQVVADLTTGIFLKPDNSPLFTGSANENFAMSFKGYIEFPSAGKYVFNTNCSDGSVVWIGGKIVVQGPLDSWPGDNGPGFIYVPQAGIYDIRMDFFKRERSGNPATDLELCQYLPDGVTRVLVNDPADSPGAVKVYRTLQGAPSSTTYRNPVLVAASSAVGGLDRGGDPGARFRVVNATYTYELGGEGGGRQGSGGDQLMSWEGVVELLGAVLDGVPSLNQHGTLAADTVVAQFNMSATADFPGPPQENWFVGRGSGVLALTQGGHLFYLHSDDGFRLTIGGKMVVDSGPMWDKDMRFYIRAEADGLYPFSFEFNEAWGGNVLIWSEIEAALTPTGFAWTTEPVNTGKAAKMYVSVTPCGIPHPDADKDGDVDQADFGMFQGCFTGAGNTVALSEACRCFDRQASGEAGYGSVDMNDLTEFTNCVTGPGIPWETVKGLLPNCKP